MKMIKNLLGGAFFCIVLAVAVLALKECDLQAIWPLSSCRPSLKIDMNIVKKVENAMPIVIIGSGPAALSAGIYGARGGADTLVIRGDKPGGALTETSYIENWPGRTKIMGPQLMTELHEQAKSFGVSFLNDTVDNVDFSSWPFTVHTEGGKTINALTVIIATGSTPRTLGIPGEQQYWGKGVTTCAICDAPFHKDHDVVVIGGGDSAAEEAMQLAPYAKNVIILVRKDQMRAAASMQARLTEYPNISITYNVEVKKITGDGQEVSHIELHNNKTNKTEQMAVKGVFLAIGHEPNTVLFEHALKTNKEGYLKVIGRTQQTSIPGVYAAGDIQDDRYRQAGVAAGHGIAAALDAGKFLQEHGYSPQVARGLASNLFNPTADETKQIELLANNQEFADAIEKADGPVVLDFYAEYCPSCMRMLPDLETVAYQFGDQVTFYKVDLDQSKELAERFQVKSIPALLVFSDGQLVGRYNEAMNKKELHTFVKRFVKA